MSCREKRKKKQKESFLAWEALFVREPSLVSILS
jgi:hypothetical protein